jgi:hydroxyacylglutathione hydrolase
MTKQPIHEVLPVGMLQCNCSVLGDSVTREAIVVDPGDDVENILAILRKHNLKVRAIVSTHTHIDHVGGLAKLHEVTGAPVLIHQDDLELYRRLDAQAQWLGVPTPAMTDVDHFLREGDSLRWGPYQAHVIHTPGHTQGSISLYVPSELASDAASDRASDRASSVESHPASLLAGDTLFAGSIGRTDLWGGSFPEIIRSIQQKLLSLPERTIVYPGHGPRTTIGEERETNPFLKSG